MKPKRSVFDRPSTDPSRENGPGLARAKDVGGERVLGRDLPDDEAVHADRESGSMRVGERRSFLRVAVDLEVSLGAETGPFTARSVNLCPSGLLVSSFRVLDLGLPLSVEFDLPASKVVTQGVVLWSRDATFWSIPCYGIAFTELTRFDRTLILAFCASLAPDAYPGFSSDRRLAG
jgi:hypothetical protein